MRLNHTRFLRFWPNKKKSLMAEFKKGMGRNHAKKRGKMNKKN